MRLYFAEWFGTLCLVFFGCGAIVVQNQTQALTHVGVCLVFGFIVTSLIYALGPISGTHINPAVSIALAADGKLPWRHLPGYLLAQCFGACCGAWSLNLIVWDIERNFGQTLPHPKFTQFQAGGLEWVLTLFLMFVILRVTASEATKPLAGILIGMVVALEALFAGPLTGASMNPARSLGPAVAAGNLEHMGLYFVGPILGALTAVAIDRFVRNPESTQGV